MAEQSIANVLMGYPRISELSRGTAVTHLRIISVGRLVEKKGFDVLVDAIALLVERGVQVTAAIAGGSTDLLEWAATTDVVWNRRST
jgi:glycosyltransferase involved in cell wall biosynthesis